MNPNHLSLLVCPKTLKPLVLKDAEIAPNGRIRSGLLVEPESGAAYPIRDFIPRFTPEENYADNFGLEWNEHRRTQYDEDSGFSISKERFAKETGWGADLSGKLMLEAGSGSGRFTRHALETGALVVSFDYSSAVAANHASNGDSDNLLLVQASLYEMPFPRSFFDLAFCFGVLQHTPDPKRSFLSLVPMLKPGGKLACDIYKLTFLTPLYSKYWVRPFTRTMKPRRLYELVRRYVDFMWPLARRLRRIPKIGKSLNWTLLVADYSRLLPGAPDEVLKQWAYLDTFDMLSPRYDRPASLTTFRRWFHEAGLGDVDVRYGYNGVEGRGTVAGATGRDAA